MRGTCEGCAATEVSTALEFPDGRVMVVCRPCCVRLRESNREKKIELSAKPLGLYKARKHDGTNTKEK